MVTKEKAVFGLAVCFCFLKVKEGLAVFTSGLLRDLKLTVNDLEIFLKVFFVLLVRLSSSLSLSLSLFSLFFFVFLFSEFCLFTRIPHRQGDLHDVVTTQVRRVRSDREGAGHADLDRGQGSEGVGRGSWGANKET